MGAGSLVCCGQASPGGQAGGRRSVASLLAHPSSDTQPPPAPFPSSFEPSTAMSLPTVPASITGPFVRPRCSFVLARPSLQPVHAACRRPPPSERPRLGHRTSLSLTSQYESPSSDPSPSSASPARPTSSPRLPRSPRNCLSRRRASSRTRLVAFRTRTNSGCTSSMVGMLPEMKMREHDD